MHMERDRDQGPKYPHDSGWGDSKEHLAEILAAQ